MEIDRKPEREASMKIDRKPEREASMEIDRKPAREASMEQGNTLGNWGTVFLKIYNKN